MTRILEFAIGSADRARLRLQVRGRERPDLTDTDDSNWLAAVVEIRSGTMTGSVAFSLRTEDLSDFRAGLATMTDDQNATAACKTMEDLIAIHLTRSPPRHLTVAGHIGEPPPGNRLTFHFDADATTIPLMLQDLDEILAEYPAK